MIRIIPLIRWRIYVPKRSFGTTIGAFNNVSKSSSPQFANTDKDGKTKESAKEDTNVETTVQERLSKILADISENKRSVDGQEGSAGGTTGRSITDHTREDFDTHSSADPVNMRNTSVPGIDGQTQEKANLNANTQQPPFGTQTSTKDSTNNDNSAGSTYTYADIFNIKQIIDTVKQSENVKQLQQELTTFYQKKKKDQQVLAESLSQRMGQNVVELKRSISIASKVINEITGYNKVIRLKDIIVENEQKLKDLKESIHEAKVEHEKALDLRSSSQKEVNELLERKNSWKPTDLDRFTRIYMTTHDLDTSVKEMSERLKYLEDLQESTHDALIRSIMNRYHEEQVWSDKIRQFSTWGTILIMCINLLLVLLVQFVFEPFKRWRLVNSFEDKVKDLFHNSEKLDLDIQQLKGQLDTLKLKPAAAAAAAAAASEKVGDAISVPEPEPELKPAPEPALLENPPVENIVAAKEASAEQSPLPPFRLIANKRLDTVTLRKYWTHYYMLTSDWLHKFVHYMTPLAYPSSTPLETTVGEFQGYVCGSILTSAVLGILLGRLVA
ncbi:hypothetical protein PMKS-002676 [Pichia membranifaciens]|uniref:Sensitive to high expression protein 9, mitochondrial n=1 Tax=Pichia membranifaciens TaxID=4926 RepID=A0A1Q2YI24_9ASCO|nr:hypothetical protein PMKS-002676 [Pichia membranifaciens]